MTELQAVEVKKPFGEISWTGNSAKTITKHFYIACSPDEALIVHLIDVEENGK